HWPHEQPLPRTRQKLFCTCNWRQGRLRRSNWASRQCAPASVSTSLLKTFMRSAIFLIVFAIAALSIRAAVIVPEHREPDDGVVQAWKDNTQDKREASIGDRITVVLKNFDDWL